MGHDGATAISATVCQHFANEETSGQRTEKEEVATPIRLGWANSSDTGTRWKMWNLKHRPKGTMESPLLRPVCGNSYY